MVPHGPSEARPDDGPSLTCRPNSAAATQPSHAHSRSLEFHLRPAGERRLMSSVFASAVWLFGYAFLSNVALAVLPHEPVIIWYGARHGVWSTALVATAGTVVAALLDHRLLAPLIERAAGR